jgi:hypothetical protein
VHQVHTGTAAAVHEIRQSGPQDLWRFYRVRAVDGTLIGWVGAGYVKESPAWEFLLNLEHEHDH